MRMRNMILYIGSSLLPSFIIAITFVVVPELRPEEEMIPIEEEVVEEEAATLIGQILTRNAVLYSDIHRTRIFAKLEKGTLVDIVAKGDEWWLVKYAEMEGYIDSDYIVQVDEFNRALLEQPIIVLSEGIIPKEGSETADPNLSDTDTEAETEDTDRTGVGAEEIAGGEESLSGEIIQILEEELRERRYTVIRIREKDRQGLGERDCCDIANEIQADAFLTVFEDGGQNGIQVICPVESNPNITGWVYKHSQQMAEYIANACMTEAGSEEKGLEERDDLAELNWSKVPLTVLKVGRQTDADNAENIPDEFFQEKTALGIANGVDYYFGRKSVPATEETGHSDATDENSASEQTTVPEKDGTVSGNEPQ